MAITATYVKEGYRPPADPFLSKEVYQEVLTRWPKPCVDAVLYFQYEGKTYMVLGKRKIQPQQDWWIFGGRVFVTDESLPAAMARKLHEEVGLDVGVGSIPNEPFRIHMYKWPEDGSVSIACTFLVEIARVDYLQMVANVAKSPEYSEYDALDPSWVTKQEGYHQAVRDCAEILL